VRTKAEAKHMIILIFTMRLKFCLIRRQKDKKDMHLDVEEFIKGKHFSDKNLPIETDLIAFLNHGYEIKNLLQADVLRANRSRISP